MRYKSLSLLLLCVFISQAQTPLNCLTSTKGGSCYEVCYYNNHLYAGCANTLTVYDLTGPNNTPGAKTFEYRFISNIDNIQVHNGKMYVCTNHDGLWKLDVSNPAAPSVISHYSPASISESIYDIGFYGDSIIAAAKNKVNIILDSNNTLTLIGSIASFTGTTRIHGIDVKDSLLAYTVGMAASSSQKGVYLYDLKNAAQLDFYNQTTGDGWEIDFGKNNKLLHVSGGNIPFTANGIYYALDYSNPASLVLKKQDTLKGFIGIGSLAIPMSIKLINDTVYVSTQGAGPIGYTFPNPFTGQVYVYDATNPNNISLLTDIYAGLYHFDTDINPATRKMYVASEWYGVLTVDVSDIYNEIDLGKTLTGGWCHGSSKAKNKLVEASEGYGVRMFDVSTPQMPQLIKEDTAVGFCRAISITDSADYVYAWYLTGQRLRIYDGNLNLVNAINADSTTVLLSDYAKSRYHNKKLAVIEDVPVLFSTQRKLLTADLTNPAAPNIFSIRRNDKLRDILFHSNGDLFVLSDDTINVFNSAAMSIYSYVVPPLGAAQPYKAFTLSNDTLYVCYDGIGEGISKYIYNPTTHTLTYSSASVYLLDMPAAGRVHMASDEDYIYITSTLDKLKAITKTSPHSVISAYDHGADFVYDNLWGTTDLYYKEGHLYLNEYKGQTSIFGAPVTTSASAVTLKNFSAYPNPANEFITIDSGTESESLLRIFDVSGKLVYINEMFGKKIKFNTSNLPNGIYIAEISSEENLRTEKIIISR